MSLKDYYQILGVSRDASAGDNGWWQDLGYLEVG